MDMCPFKFKFIIIIIIIIITIINTVILYQWIPFWISPNSLPTEHHPPRHLSHG